eukprot:scaffold47692_cov30-Tisochrysis_lutea.AAC.2
MLHAHVFKAGTSKAQPPTDVPFEANETVHVQLYVSKAPTSSGSLKASPQASTRSGLSSPILLSPPWIEPLRGSSANVTLTNARPHILVPRMHPTHTNV